MAVKLGRSGTLPVDLHQGKDIPRGRVTLFQPASPPLLEFFLPKVHGCVHAHAQAWKRHAWKFISPLAQQKAAIIESRLPVETKNKKWDQVRRINEWKDLMGCLMGC